MNDLDADVPGAVMSPATPPRSDGDGESSDSASESVVERSRDRIDEMERERSVASADPDEKGHGLVDELAETLQGLSDDGNSKW